MPTWCSHPERGRRGGGPAEGFDLVSPYPRIVAVGAGERLVQPLLQWSWLTFLPLRAMERSRRPALAAAGGQFLVVTRAGYERAGGHAAVRDRVLEDIELARAVKRSGGRVALADGSRIASCRMYESWRDLASGYTKVAVGQRSPRRSLRPPSCLSSCSCTPHRRFWLSSGRQSRHRAWTGRSPRRPTSLASSAG